VRKITPLLACLVRRLRPAPLASAVARISRLSERRIVQTPNGAFWLNPVSNLGYSLMRGEYEARMQAILEQYLYPGAVFVDLGANEGYFTVMASRLVGPRGTVMAVEPQSRLQGVIAVNLGLNQCFNVRLARAVLSDKTELASLFLATEMYSGATSLFPGGRYRRKTESVQSFTLAEFLDRCGLEKCDLMKVDIEGAEYDLFIGARRVLERGMIRTIALEFHPSILKQRGLSHDDLGRLISSCGYNYLGDSIYRWNEPRSP
jgi:FkbM family methyltransferase